MKWDIDQTHGVMWIAGEAAKSLLGSMKNETGICFTELLCYCHDHNFNWCTLEEENIKVGSFLVERFKDKKFADKFVKDYKEFDKNTVKKLEDLDKKDISKFSDDELFELLEVTTNLYIKNFDWGFIIEPMDFVMPGLIEPALVKKGFSPAEIADILAVADTTFLNIETQELIAIAKQPEEKQKTLLKEHAYKYRWIHSAHMGRKDIPLSYFEDNLNDLKQKDLDKELEKLKSLESNVKKRKNQILDQNPLNKETKLLIEIADLISPLHDRRKELFLRTIYTLDTVRGEIAKRFGYTKDQLNVFQLEDVMQLNKGETLNKDDADEMIKHCVLYVDTKKNIWKYYKGQEAKEFAEKELKVDFSGINEVKGMVASVGKALGKVKIVKGESDIYKVEQGDILVVPMTRPEILPAIKKSAAIVTDEGGVTCHAAIVSRELGIPCVIGTKIATFVFKDGDLIEVDASDGVVRKVS